MRRTAGRSSSAVCSGSCAPSRTSTSSRHRRQPTHTNYEREGDINEVRKHRVWRKAAAGRSPEGWAALGITGAICAATTGLVTGATPAAAAVITQGDLIVVDANAFSPDGGIIDVNP